MRIGTHLRGRYQLLEQIASGGFGSLYVAQDSQRSKRVAIKILHPEVLKDAEAYERFKREATVASRIEHPNIVRVIGFEIAEDKAPFIVMEYLTGQDLESLLSQRWSLPLSEVALVVEGVGSALHAVHGQKIVHRDLKPQNIFLRANAGYPPTPIVLDFGVSKILGSNTLTATRCYLGTPYYMSPEQAEGRAVDVDPRSDIFSLGTIAYRMLSGVLPFNAKNDVGVLRAIVNKEPPSISSIVSTIPPDVDQIVSQALAKDPAQRFQTMQQFVAALLKALRAT